MSGRRPGRLARRPALLAVALTGLFVVTVACSTLNYEPTTTRVDGRSVFRIYSASCPKNASCAAGLIINKQFYAVSFSVPKVSYWNGPLFAVGHDQEAHLIPSLSTAFYQVLALRQGSD